MSLIIFKPMQSFYLWDVIISVYQKVVEKWGICSETAGKILVMTVSRVGFEKFKSNI